MIWITSDWHFGHNKEFLWGPRGFKNEYEMGEALVKNYNALVDADDDVYCLGDLMLSNNDEGLMRIKSLKGRIHVIRGNHDSDARMELYSNCYNIVEICEAKYLRYGKYHFYLSHYPTLTANYDDDKPLKTKMVSLCGHTHTPDKWHDWDKGLIYHCEVDSHGNKPVSIEQIISDIKEKVK